MSDNKKYYDWIANWVSNQKSIWGLCKQGATEMQKQFPELIVVPGWVSTIAGDRDHWWCETVDSEILDPTASQFKEMQIGIFGYRKFQPGDEVRVGKCMNCGEEIWLPVQSLTERPEFPPEVSDCCCSSDCEYELMLIEGGDGTCPIAIDNEQDLLEYEEKLLIDEEALLHD
jgi:hypothetical protein